MMFKKFNILTYHNQRQYLDDKFQIGEWTQTQSWHGFPKTSDTRQLKQASSILQLINFCVLNKFNATFHVMLQSWGTQRLFNQVQKSWKRYTGGWEQRITFTCLYCCPRPEPSSTPYHLWQSKHMHTVHNKKGYSQSSHHNMEIEAISSKRKAPYISYLEGLVGACSCTRV